MPRKSSAALAAVPLLPGARLAPPKRLNADQADVWRQVVASKPADWFGADTAPLLEAYCTAVVAHRWTSKKRSDFEASATAESDMKAYDRLSKIEDRQARLVGTLATSMRLTQQSRYTPKSASTASKKASAPRPWERVAS